MIVAPTRLRPVSVLVALAASLGCAPGQSAPGRLFGTVEDALALVRTFGPGWQAAEEGEMPGGVRVREGLRMRRFQFGERQHVIIGTDAKGIVRHFGVHDFTARNPDDRVHPQSCAALPDYARLATLLLDAAEPGHGPRDLNLVVSAAKLGWTPVHGLFSVKVNNSVFTFQSYGKKCSAEVREYRPLPSS